MPSLNGKLVGEAGILEEDQIVSFWHVEYEGFIRRDRYQSLEFKRGLS